MTHAADYDAPVHFRWMTYWPHAVPNVLAVRDTPHKDEVTCEACLWALGNQKHEPPTTSVIPPDMSAQPDAEEQRC